MRRGEIPSPEANVNATKALTAYRIDIKVGDRMLEGADTFDLLAVSKNRRLWGEYWVVRHPNPEVRRKLAAAIVEAEKLDEEIFVKALRQLERAEAHGKATKQPLRRTIYAFDPWLALPQAQYSGRQLA